MVAVVHARTESVEAILMSAAAAVSPASMVGFLTGPMTQHVQRRAEERFMQEGDDASGAWEPLKEATKNWRDAYGYPREHPINVRSGELERYITQSAPAVVATAVGAALTYPGTPAAGGAPGTLGAKLKGAQQGEGSAPARPVLGLSSVDLAAALVTLNGWLTAAIIGGRI